MLGVVGYAAHADVVIASVHFLIIIHQTLKAVFNRIKLTETLDIGRSMPSSPSHAHVLQL